MLKEALQAYLMQRLAPDGMLLNRRAVIVSRDPGGRGGAGIEEEVGDFGAGKAADLVYLRPRAEYPPRSQRREDRKISGRS